MATHDGIWSLAGTPAQQWCPAVFVYWQPHHVFMRSDCYGLVTRTRYGGAMICCDTSRSPAY
jgi:hypothetical protein